MTNIKRPHCANNSKINIKIEERREINTLTHTYMTAHLTHTYMTAHLTHTYMIAHLTHTYMTAHFPGSVQTLQETVARD
jgi:hypothetical protein